MGSRCHHDRRLRVRRRPLAARRCRDVYFRRQLGAEPGPPAAWSEVTPNLGWLLLGSVFAAGLVNAGPIVVDLLADNNMANLVTWFGSGVLLGRIPLFLFQAVQAALLPRLAGLIGRGELVEFRQGFRKLLLVVSGVAVLGVAGSVLLGPFLLEKVFQADLSTRTMTMLAAGSGIYMIALTFAQAVIALHGHSLVAIGWLVGMITFAGVTWLSSDDALPSRRARTGLLVDRRGRALRHRVAVPPQSRCGARRRFAAPSGNRRPLRGVASGCRPGETASAGDAGLLRLQLEVVGDHHPDQLGELHLGLPAELGARLGRIADQQIDLGRAEEAFGS